MAPNESGTATAAWNPSRVERFNPSADAEKSATLRPARACRPSRGPAAAAGKAVNFASALPLTQPAPDIVFADKTFCFTGTFAFGQRKDCQAAVARLGGTPQDKVTTRLDYLVIGSLGNEDWMHSTCGRKIQQALDFNAKGRGIAIVSEDAWAQALCAAE